MRRRTTKIAALRQLYLRLESGDPNLREARRAAVFANNRGFHLGRQ
jgi:hypothetical protein